MVLAEEALTNGLQFTKKDYAWGTCVWGDLEIMLDMLRPAVDMSFPGKSRPITIVKHPISILHEGACGVGSLGGVKGWRGKLMLYI